MLDDQYDAVVYDLDGTLVRLDVDWGAVTRDVRAVYTNHGIDDADGGLWDLYLAADTYDIADEVEDTISEHERNGASSSTRLPLADGVAAHSVPVGVCSLNAEGPVRLALESHGLSTKIDAVIGRDSVPEQKPDPGPLLTTVENLPGTVDEPVFVGDSPRDRTAAERAGIAYRGVGSLL
ncbi:HAD family hydrolase [Natranaeroarchaeum aerophilus]|uniref:HAD hydrolase-like protein n=1 Tax=Natranaeroarchaeum aerophilus TaxID=2917711 RepID=A0AAE3FS17_9EURY|nr:HAD hydrolase-like protein [Natranaeroarchaeum aerophilus]MCL9813858.1 HAD hydrolase-like protein [Natranaeroarchaeum aerophilus]